MNSLWVSRSCSQEIIQSCLFDSTVTPTGSDLDLCSLKVFSGN